MLKYGSAALQNVACLRYRIKAHSGVVLLLEYVVPE